MRTHKVWGWLIFFVAQVLFAVPAHAQRATPDALERYVRRGIMEVAATCRDARAVEALGDAPSVRDDASARNLLVHCAGTSPLDASLVGDDAERQRAVLALRGEIRRRASLAAVCARRTQLAAWRNAHPLTGVESAALRDALQALLPTPPAASPCETSASAAASASSLDATKLARLQDLIDALAAQPTITPDQLVRHLSDAPQRVGALALTDGVPDVSSVATSFISMALEGVAQFLQNRARAEIQVYMIDRMRVEVCGEGKPGALYLRTTCAFLGLRDDFFAPNFGPSFVAAVADDAVHLPARFGEYMDGHKSDFRALPGVAARAGVRLVESLSTTVNLAENAAAVRDTMVRWCPAEGDPQCVQGVAVLRVALTVIEGAARRTNPQTDTEFQRELFESIQQLVGTSNPLSRERFDALLRQVGEVQQAVERYRSAADREARVARVEPLVASLISLFNDALDMVDSNQSVPRFPNSLSGFFDAMARRNVADVVLQATRVALDVARDASVRDHLRISPDALRVLTFGGDLASARSAEQMSAAIESFAAPAGSWRLKSNHMMTLSVGGAFGLAGGLEWAQSVSHLPAAEAMGFGQLFAPVGFDLSLSPHHAFHLGLLVSVVDVGALVPVGGARDEARRFSPTSFLAPGAFLRFGFASVPLVFGFGVSYRPFAHVVAPVTGGSEQVDPAVTAMGFVAIDVPIYMLWTSSGCH